jgi:hypothetical protein
MRPDFLGDLFIASFWFGAAATVLSFALGLGRHGGPHIHLHLPGVGHVGHLGGHGAALHHGAAGAQGVSPFNLNSILAFLVVFGAVGLSLEHGVGSVLALLFASGGGLIAGWLVFLFIARFLIRGETYLIDEPLVGTIGTISVSIGPGHVGEVIYTRHNARRSDGARSVDGTPIGAGEEVVIVGYQHGIATVQRWKEFYDELPEAQDAKRKTQTNEPGSVLGPGPGQ